MMIAQTGKKTKTLPEGLTKAWLFLWPFLAEAQFMLFYSYIYRFLNFYVSLRWIFGFLVCLVVFLVSVVKR